MINKILIITNDNDNTHNNTNHGTNTYIPFNTHIFHTVEAASEEASEKGLVKHLLFLSLYVFVRYVCV